ncbi:MAG: protein kinase [Pirellulaceae bacterium]|nr:protein kinase [Pirellulaceae bacterium]
MPQNAEDLTDLLVRANRLTRFQQSCVLQRKANLLSLGRYLILDKLGEGGMGTVYRARHRHMNRVVALKMLPRKLLRNRDVSERFRREVEMAAKLVHPNIVTAFDAVVVGQSHFLVMEYIDGTDLSTYVRQRGPLSSRLAIHFLLSAAKGLQYAHGLGVVHRDIKPGNLLVDRQGVVKITDMGLARFIERSGAVKHDDLTTAGEILGTLDYMAPEQAMNVKGNDLRSDIYGLGCTLHFLLTGQPIYAGDSPPQILLAHREQPVPDLAERCGDVLPGLNDVFQKMVAKRPADRFQTMREVIRALQQVQGIRGKGPRPAGRSKVLEPELATFLRGQAASPIANGRGITVEASPVRPESVTTQAAPKPARRPTRRRKLLAAAALGATAVILAVVLLGPSWDHLLSNHWVQAAPAAPETTGGHGPPATAAGPLTTTPVAHGSPNYALRFDGRESFVSVPSLVFDPKQPWTIEAWVRPADTTGEVIQTCLGWHESVWLTYCGTSRVLAAYVSTPGIGWAQLHSTSVSKSNENIHLAAVFADGYMSFYVNGVRQERPMIVNNVQNLPRTATFGIGARLPSAAGGASVEPLSYFEGLIDEVRVSNSSRYDSRFTPIKRFQVDNQTVCLFHCDEGEGNILHDASPNGHQGVIHAAAWEKVESP